VEPGLAVETFLPIRSGWSNSGNGSAPTLLVGDFLNLGYDQAMLFDRAKTGGGAYFGNNSRMMVIDFRNGKPPAHVLFRSDVP
jgi:hypothetical protein